VKFLLDTHILVWLAAEPARVSSSVAQRLRAPEAELLLSVASWWELAINDAAGRLESAISPMELREAWLCRQNVTELAIGAQHVFEAAALPPVHKDPFDRVLVAQARLERATLVTVDTILPGYDVAILAAGV
jgi:PIN domain nuclease of toxin-antitoxin system